MEKEAASLAQERLTTPFETEEGGLYTYNEDLNAERVKHGKTGGWWIWIRKNLNFFRIFLLTFVFLPLITSVIFWAVNTEYEVAYVDALYLCYSTFTNTGLSPIDLSHTTTFQQVMMFVQMFLGCPIFISWVVVIVRKDIMASQCAHWVEEQRGVRANARGAITKVLPFKSKTVDETSCSNQIEQGAPKSPPRRSATGIIKPFHKSSISRLDTEPRMIDPSCRISERVDTREIPPEIVYEADNASQQEEPSSPLPVFDSPKSRLAESTDRDSRIGDLLPQNGSTSPPLPVSDPSPPSTFPQLSPSIPCPAEGSPRVAGFVPSQNFATGVSTTQRAGNLRQRGATTSIPRTRTFTEIDIRPRQRTMRASTSYNLPQVDQHLISRRSIGLGGFPGPLELLRAFGRLLSSRLERWKYGKIFRPSPSILLPVGQARPGQLARYDTKEVPYFSFAAVVGKNSTFHGLSEEELDELGGVEYRGLRILAWLVPIYYILIQALGWAVNGALFSKPQYNGLFSGQWKFVQPSWAGVFMGTSAVTNSGMSLVDTGLIPFQGEFGVLITTSFESLAGNTAFPIFLRLTIWIATKLLPSSTEAWATLHFLLDHPRRCFLYLFPSHQTWFLVIVLVILNGIDWAGFMLFDLGNPVLEAIPINWRVLNGLLQATSVRCAGVASVGIALLAPATQTLFLIMMYIAPYPIALAVRSTNVYQDRSLGIYEEESDSDSEYEKEREFERDKRSRPVVWGSYLAWHARRQLSYDIWWVAAAWLLVSIFERGKIWDPATKQFDLFGILFEIVSAYGSVGLSLGLSTANYSMSGAWSPASKVVLCLVMVRGRSRGLPVAIDRAIMLPKEFGTVSPQSRSQQQLDQPAHSQEFEPMPTILEKPPK